MTSMLQTALGKQPIFVTFPSRLQARCLTVLFTLSVVAAAIAPMPLLLIHFVAVTAIEWLYRRRLDSSALAQLFGCIVVSIGYRVSLSGGETPLTEEEARLVSRYSLFVINLYYDDHLEHRREIVFLRRSDAVRFKLSY